MTNQLHRRLHDFAEKSGVDFRRLFGRTDGDLDTTAKSNLVDAINEIYGLALVGVAGVASFNARTGAVTLTTGDVTTALGYTPTSVTGLTGVQSAAGFKTGLTLVKADVGLGSVDNTADAAKNVLTATKLVTARNINGVAFDGTADITVNAVDATARAPASRSIATTAPLTGGGDLSANRTLAISAASGAEAGSMSAADKTKLDAITGTNTGDQTASSLGLGTSDSPQFAGVNIGAATDTTITRASAGVIAVEGVTLLTTATGQPLDADLTAIAALSSAADKLAYATGSGAWALADLTSVARTLIAQTTQALMRSTGLGLGTSAVVDTGTSGTKVPLLDGANTWSADQIVPAEVYGSGWNGSNEAPTKNDVYDKIEAVLAIPGYKTLIQHIDADGSTVNFIASSIPATFKGIEVVICLQSYGSSLKLRFNGDNSGTNGTTGKYNVQRNLVANGATATQLLLQNQADLGVGGAPCQFIGTMLNYNLLFRKGMTIAEGGFFTTGSGGIGTVQHSVMWDNTTTVNEIDVIAQSAPPVGAGYVRVFGIN